MLCQIILLVIVSWNNRRLVNPDTISYMRIASYYARGQTDLMVSAYWGPMLSWLIAPLLGLVSEPVDAARIAIGLSAVVFVLGCASVFRSFELRPSAVVLGTWIAVLASVAWAATTMTPDLLLSGLVFLAVSLMTAARWPQSRHLQLGGGILWGAAYLTKAVAFPIAFGVSIGIGALRVLSRDGKPAAVLQGMGLTFLGFMLLAGPWVVTLSWKYQGLMVSTSARIAHAMVGPPGVDRGMLADPMIIHPPEPGRLWWGEDTPRHLYEDKYWSPFQNLAYARHQVKVILSHIKVALRYLSTFDPLHVGILAALFGFFVHTPWRENMRQERWRWAGVPIACVCGVYLPLYLYEERYFYPTYPFLLAAGMGMVVWLTRGVHGRVNVPRLIGFGLLALAFVYPFATRLPQALKGLKDVRTEYAHDLATRLLAADVSGPIVGAGGYDNLWGGYGAGLFIAFYINQPYLGNEASPTIEGFKKSNATLVIVDRQLPVVDKLARDATFQDLDGILFRTPMQAKEYPMKVYRIGARGRE